MDDRLEYRVNTDEPVYVGLYNFRLPVIASSVRGIIFAAGFILMELAGQLGSGNVHSMQEVVDVLLKVHRHYRGRYGRVTDDLAGEDGDILCTEDLIQVVKVIDRKAGIIRVRRVDAELLVAVDEIDQRIVA